MIQYPQYWVILLVGEVWWSFSLGINLPRLLFPFSMGNMITPSSQKGSYFCTQERKLMPFVLHFRDQRVLRKKAPQPTNVATMQKLQRCFGNKPKSLKGWKLWSKWKKWKYFFFSCKKRGSFACQRPASQSKKLVEKKPVNSRWWSSQ